MPEDLKPIRTPKDHAWAMAEVERLWGARKGTAEGNRLDILATLIDVYEAEAFPMDQPDPIAAIEFRMEQMGLSRKDLEPMIGTRARVAEVFSGKRGLSVNMIRRLNEDLGIPAEALLQAPKRSSKPTRSRTYGTAAPKRAKA